MVIFNSYVSLPGRVCHVEMWHTSPCDFTWVTILENWHRTWAELVAPHRAAVSIWSSWDYIVVLLDSQDAMSRRNTHKNSSLGECNMSRAALYYLYSENNMGVQLGLYIHIHPISTSDVTTRIIRSPSYPPVLSSVACGKIPTLKFGVFPVETSI